MISAVLPLFQATIKSFTAGSSPCNIQSKLIKMFKGVVKVKKNN